MRSFIPVDSKSHFPIQNLPYGVFCTKEDNAPRIGTALGEYVLDLALLEKEGYFKDTLNRTESIFNESSLNKFMEKGKKVWQEIRKTLQSVLDEDEPKL